MMAALSGKVELLSLAEAARLLPKAPNPATLWRWRTKGIRGVRLKTVLVGGRRYVSRAALNRFIQAVTAATQQSDGPSAAAAPQKGSTRRRSAETSRRLKEAGLAK
jgi:hypothetical protein